MKGDVFQPGKETNQERFDSLKRGKSTDRISMHTEFDLDHKSLLRTHIINYM